MDLLQKNESAQKYATIELFVLSRSTHSYLKNLGVAGYMYLFIAPNLHTALD